MSDVGIVQMRAAAYHADPCPSPSLSASIAHILLTQSPRHAWTAHPKLNPSAVHEESEQFDLGTAAHAYLLEGESNIVLIDAADYRKAETRVIRDQARREGKIPILRHRWDDVRAMATRARSQLAAQEYPEPLTAGKAEQTLIWQEGDLWCRARLDWLHDDHTVIDDYKTTGGSAEPAAWIRGSLFANGYDLQAAWYARGVKALTQEEATFRFVVQENYPPYALSVVALGPDVLALAAQKVETALRLWRECLATNAWPGYPTRTCWAELPPWEEQRWAQRYLHEDTTPPIVDPGGDIGDLL